MTCNMDFPPFLHVSNQGFFFKYHALWADTIFQLKTHHGDLIRAEASGAVGAVCWVTGFHCLWASLAACGPQKNPPWVRANPAFLWKRLTQVLDQKWKENQLSDQTTGKRHSCRDCFNRWPSLIRFLFSISKEFFCISKVLFKCFLHTSFLLPLLLRLLLLSAVQTSWLPCFFCYLSLATVKHLEKVSMTFCLLNFASSSCFCPAEQCSNRWENVGLYKFIALKECGSKMSALFSDVCNSIAFLIIQRLVLRCSQYSGSTLLGSVTQGFCSWCWSGCDWFLWFLFPAKLKGEGKKLMIFFFKTCWRKTLKTGKMCSHEYAPGLWGSCFFIVASLILTEKVVVGNNRVETTSCVCVEGRGGIAWLLVAV